MHSTQPAQTTALITQLNELIKALPNDSHTLSLISLINKLMSKLRLPAFMQGPEVSMLTFQFIMAFFKVNVWSWAGSTFAEDPHKNLKVATVFASFIGLIPPLLSYAHRYFSSSEMNIVRELPLLAKNIVTLEGVVLAYYSGASLAHSQDELSLALQQSIQTAAYLVLAEKMIPTLMTGTANLIMSTLSVAKRVLNKIYYGHPELPLMVDASQQPLLPHSINSATQTLPMNPEMEHVISVINKYRSIPYLFLFLLIGLFMLLSFYQPFATGLTERGISNNYRQANFLGFCALCLSVVIANLEAKLL